MYFSSPFAAATKVAKALEPVTVKVTMPSKTSAQVPAAAAAAAAVSKTPAKSPAATTAATTKALAVTSNHSSKKRKAEVPKGYLKYIGV